jgi:hypothetical protein
VHAQRAIIIIIIIIVVVVVYVSRMDRARGHVRFSILPSFPLLGFLRVSLGR